MLGFLKQFITASSHIFRSSSCTDLSLEATVKAEPLQESITQYWVLSYKSIYSKDTCPLSIIWGETRIVCCVLRVEDRFSTLIEIHI